MIAFSGNTQNIVGASRTLFRVCNIMFPGVRSLIAPIAVLAALMSVLSLGACTREVIKEVPVEVTREVVATPAAAATQPPADESTGPQVYQLGIFEDLTTTNYWSFLGPDTTIWNSYVLGGKPTLYGLSSQRFDWVPSAAADFPTPLAQETVGGETLWTTEVDLKQGLLWSDGVELTAEDFVFTAHTVRDLELTGNWSSIVDNEFFDRAEALGPYKLKIYFKKKPGLARWQFGLAYLPIFIQELLGSHCRAGQERDGHPGTAEGPVRARARKRAQRRRFYLQQMGKGSICRKRQEPRLLFLRRPGCPIRQRRLLGEQARSV